jgi:hypothetical protein
VSTQETDLRVRTLNAKLINAALRGVYEKAGELIEASDFSSDLGDSQRTIAQTTQSLTKEIMALNYVRETDWNNLTENEQFAVDAGVIKQPS